MAMLASAEGTKTSHVVVEPSAPLLDVDPATPDSSHAFGTSAAPHTTPSEGLTP